MINKVNPSDKTSVPSPRKEPLDFKSRFLAQRFSMITFLFIISIFLCIALFYLFNLLVWIRDPDFGWALYDQMGKMVVQEVHDEAIKAGLQEGDRILKTNTMNITSLGELRRYINRDIPGENVYEVERNGLVYTITIPNKASGFQKTFSRFGFT